MAIRDLFRPKWQHSNPEVRRKAIEAVADVRTLALIFASDAGLNSTVRDKIEKADAAFRKAAFEAILTEAEKLAEDANTRHRAIKVLEAAILIKGIDGEIDVRCHALLGRYQYRQRQKGGFIEVDRAVRNLRHAVLLRWDASPEGLKPGDIRTNVDLRMLDWLAEAYVDRERYKEAIALCDLLLTVDPKLAMAFFSRGNAYLKLGRKEDARVDFVRALALEPNNPLFKLTVQYIV